MNDPTNQALAMLAQRGVDLKDVARLVLQLQLPYNPDLTFDECLHHVERVVKKREVQYAIIVGLTLDLQAEDGTLAEPLGSIVREDHNLFGIDEVLALSIVNVYGSIGMSNFGYLGKEKPDFLRNIRTGPQGRVNTFLDDIVAAIVAAACARIAHRRGERD